MMVDYTTLPFASFPENVFGALVGKEGYPVELVAGTLNIQLNNAGIYIGTLFEHLEGSTAWKVQLRGYIAKGYAAEGINAPGFVLAGNGGFTQVATGAGTKAHGIAIFPYVINAGDYFAYISTDCIA